MLLECGGIIAPMATIISKESAKKVDGLESLRFSVRYNTNLESGFVFINNHLRRRKLTNHNPLDISIKIGLETINLPTLHIKNGDMKILPFNLKLDNDIILVSTNAQPLIRIGSHYYFFTDEKPIYNFADKKADIITLTIEKARNAWKFGDKFYITTAGLTKEENGKIYATSCKNL